MSGIEEPSLETGVLVAGIFSFAGLVHGTLGLGFPMMATPLLAMMTDMRSAILITLLPTMAVNMISIIKGGGWRNSIGKYWPLAIYVAAGSLLGSYCLIVSDPAPFKLLLAAIILLYLNMEVLKIYRIAWIEAHLQTALLLFGLTAGFLAGTVNVMVPILIILFLELDARPTAMVQVFNMCFFAGKVTQAGVFAQQGILTGSLFAATVPLAALGVLTLILGMALRARISAQIYHRWLRKLLWVNVAVLTIQYFHQS